MFFLPRVLLLCLLALSAAAAATKPTITASDPTPAGDGKMTFGGTVSANLALTSVIFEYGTTDTYGKKTDAVFVSENGVDVAVSKTVEGLFGGRTYHFRAVAKNDAGQDVTSDDTFTVDAFAPVLTIQKAADVIGKSATLKAKITSNGTTGSALFQYAEDAAFTTPTEEPVQPVQAIDGTEEAKELSAQVEVPDRNKTYHFRLILRQAGNPDIASASETFHTNQAPVAKPDTFSLSALRPASLNVLKNDKDADSDALLVSATSSAAKGTVTATAGGLLIVYVPGPAFRGADAFTYTITDSFPSSTSAAAVTIRSFGILLAGNQGGVLVDKNGDAVGYFKITTTQSGAFSGSVLVNGEKETFSGIFGPDGRFRGSIEIDGRTVPLSLEARVSGDATTVDVSFDDGKWTSELRTTEASSKLRAELAGRYTVEFPSGTSTSDAANDGSNPAGTGWAVLKLGDTGVGRVKGRLPDGRSFSTRGVLGVASTGPVVTFFDDPRRTRVAGALSIADIISGTLKVVRDSGGSGFFAGGYGIQSTASGARYVQPTDGKRAIEGKADTSGKRLSFAVSGGNPAETFTRELRLGRDDDVKVIDRDTEGLKVKIDRDSGRFTARFTGSTDDRKIKGTGVFIQGTGTTAGRGAGVFTGEEGIGKITITAGGSSTSTDGSTTTTDGDTSTVIR